jgi:hypothetical protein
LFWYMEQSGSGNGKVRVLITRKKFPSCTNISLDSNS